MVANISLLLLMSLLLSLQESSAQSDCSTSLPNNSVVILNSRNFNSFSNVSGRFEPFPIPGWTLHNEDQVKYDAISRNVTLKWQEIIPTSRCSPQYSVCPSTNQFTPNSSLERNWIITNFFTTEATNIRIRINCISSPLFFIDCRNAIRAYYLDSDQNLTNVTSLLDQFQPTQYSTNPSSNDGLINFSFNKTERGFFIGFFNDRPCVTITNILIYYIQCPSISPTSTMLYSLPTTLSPDSTQPILIIPTCPGDLDLPSNSPASCYANGTWSLPPPGDRCECPMNTYQSEANTCRECPGRSSSLGLRGALSCSCEEGWYRGEGEAVGESCGQSPSAVRNLRVGRSPGLSVEWDQPSNSGNRNSLFYRVCYRQSLSTGVYTCEEEVSETRYNLTGLTPSIEYVVAVTSQNTVSSASGVYISVNLTFLSSFPNLTVPSYTDGYLSWNYTLFAREQYQFRIQYQSVYTGSVVTNVSITSCGIISSSNRICSVLLPNLNVLEPLTLSILDPSGPISRTYTLATIATNATIYCDSTPILFPPLLIIISISLLLLSCFYLITLVVCVVALCDRWRLFTNNGNVVQKQVVDN